MSDDKDTATVLEAWRRLRPAAGADEVVQPILEAYRQPGRYYHNLHHIAECLRELNAAPPHLCEDPVAVEIALLFHDCVYDTRRQDNEERSAEVAEAKLVEAGCGEPFRATVRRLILATKHASPPRGRDEQVTVDIDLAILGKEPDEFDAYERAIRLEYAHVPDDAFAAGRAGVLRGFLARPSIYSTPHFRGRYEQHARTNLHRSIARLEPRTL